MSKKIESKRKNKKRLKVCKKFLLSNKFTIDHNQCLSGNLEMLPELMILYFQSKNDPNIFQVTIIYRVNEDRDLKEKYYCNITGFQYPYIIKFNGQITQVYRHDVLGEWNEYDRKIYSFFENCRPTDIYEYGDFINILKGINGEITDYLYKTGNYKIDTENSINQFDNNSEFEALNDETVKKLIKKAHREYMDNKA